MSSDDMIDAGIRSQPASWCDPSDYLVLKIVRADAQDPDSLRKLVILAKSHNDNSICEYVVTKKNFLGFKDSQRHWEAFNKLYFAKIKPKAQPQVEDDQADSDASSREKLKNITIWFCMAGCALVSMFAVAALVLIYDLYLRPLIKK